MNPRDPIDNEGLGGKEDYRNLDHDELLWLVDDPKSDNERCGTCGRVTYLEERKQSTYTTGKPTSSTLRLAAHRAATFLLEEPLRR